jgi:hypothetical protein
VVLAEHSKVYQIGALLNFVGNFQLAKHAHLEILPTQQERFSPPVDNHNTTGQFDPLLHGYNGMVSVTLPGFSWPIDSMVVNATRQLPNEFPYNLDFNSGSPLGIGMSYRSVLAFHVSC